MPRYSQLSKNRLRTCHEDLQKLFEEVIKYYDCTIVCGHRGQAEQHKAFLDGYSQLDWPNSMHNRYPSLAVDAAPYENGAIDWNKDQLLFFSGYVKGLADRLYEENIITHRIRIGTDWDSDNDINDTGFFDGPHFEIIPKTIW